THPPSPRPAHSTYRMAAKATGSGCKRFRSPVRGPQYLAGFPRELNHLRVNQRRPWSKLEFAPRICILCNAKLIGPTEPMRDLDKAFTDIIASRSQLAAGTALRGYGPAAIAATSGVALLTAVLQHLFLTDPPHDPLTFFFGWAATAALSGSMIWIEMLARTRRHHSGVADAMLYRAVEQFLPAGIAGVLLAVMLWKFAPETLWLLPGLWQVLTSL